IVRIHRDYATPRERDTPTFVDAYPGFPLSLYMREGEFADLIAEVNYMLDLAFSPRAWGNVVDAVLGVASCWLSEVFYKSYHKRKILELEGFLEELNAEVYAPRGIRVISLRRSAFMSL
ncbi:Golgin subfamily A member 7/ERF4, partial [Myxozyma melibiosi]